MYTSRIGGVPMYPEEWHHINDENELTHKLPFLAENANLISGKQRGDASHKGEQHTHQKIAQNIHIKNSPMCPLCKCSMKYIAQLFAPLGHWDRFIFVWACCEDTCATKVQAADTKVQRMRWKAYRLQMLYEVSEEDEEDPGNDSANATTTTTETTTDAKDLQENFQKGTEEWALDSNANDELKQGDLDDELAKLLAENANTPVSTPSTTTTVASTTEKKTTKKSAKIRAPKGALPCYKLDIFEEPTEDDWIEENPDSQAAQIAREYRDKKGPLPNQTEFTDDSAETYEDEGISLNLGPDPTNKFKLDKQFINFQMALEKCPDQSVRWEWKGKPLWCSSRYLPGNMEDNLKKYARVHAKSEILSMSIPPCSVCKNPRTFEFQILPTIIYQLYGKHVEGIDFGSVYIFTCSSSCTPTNPSEAFLQECYVHVQPPMD
eukprot:CAMPEP_0117440854 /NCGR_PEP_ID=MMETSP0759-20121206/3312_1 /TAXON_ID=63605 /ORGANISM="Percolomonas cosmopolitus, Strain WS" /LENGTH=434 /DNA_ID=CAMNT_0005232647 /DNA_START=186 /DNA_END=1490 /DNA_ORIENTATION=+